MLQGLYSMQAVANDSVGPDVTIYRMAARDAEAWMKSTITKDRKRFKGYLLRYDENAWDVYGPSGDFVSKYEDVTGKHVAEFPGVVDVDHEVMLHEARQILRDDDVSLLAGSSWHAGSSSVDMSNFAVMTRRMIADSKPEDLEQIFIIESRLYDCRVVGIYADVSKLTQRMQDTFLERWKWVDRGWPLVCEHHTDVLADRLTKVRSDYVSEIIGRACDAAGKPLTTGQAVRSKWAMAGPTAKFKMARKLVEVLREGLVYRHREAEVFEEEFVDSASSKLLAKAFRIR